MTAPLERPGCAALAVLVRDERVLLVRRANPPDAGLWGFPGGRIEWGETAAAAAVRELREETGITAEPMGAIAVLDALDHGSDGVLRHHYLLVAILCRASEGAQESEAVAADDALEVGWFTSTEITRQAHEMSAGVSQVAQEARRWREAVAAPPQDVAGVVVAGLSPLKAMG